jgi:hypothetical protein
MKKTILHAAVVAGLAAAGSAQAVHVNPDGLGQVLLYPYYTVQNGFDTYVHVVNTTNSVKAVKVRFLEGKNSQEVLDFNLYLSPHDEWAGVITRSATTQGAVLKTADTSCIAPAALPTAGQEFRDYLYQLDNVKDLARVREGYVEVIEMGVVVDSALATAATHTSAGVPANCATVRTAAVAAGSLNSGDLAVIAAPAGGLYGFASLINVNSGMKTSYDAVAIDNFRETTAIHAAPGDTAPSLEDVNTLPDIIDGNAVVAFEPSSTAVTPGIDDLSSVLMRNRIMNDYTVDAGRDSKTDWVITFPTKRFYVNGTGPTAPFANPWSTTNSQSCDEITLRYYDREEKFHTVTVDEDFSPKPEVITPTNTLCNEVNTLTIKPHGADSTYAGLFGASYTKASFSLVDGYSYGWMYVDFDPTSAIAGTVGGVATDLVGLPVIGFAAISNTNGTLQVDGVNVLSNYMGAVTHKATRLFEQD